MVDREKVIKGLEHCKEGNLCYGCPYDIGSAECIFQFHDDVLALMKEQQEQTNLLLGHIIRKIKTEINPYGKPFEGTAYKFGKMLMDYLERIKTVEIPYDMKWNPDCEDCRPEGIDECIECRNRTEGR